MKTLFELVRENPASRRTNLINELNTLFSKIFEKKNVCTLSLVTNVFGPAIVQGASLNASLIQTLEQAFFKFRESGCKNLYLVLTTYGGDVHFPELFMSKVHEFGFESVTTVVPSIAMSAGTLMLMLSDHVIGLSSASIGPIDPQIIVMTPNGPRLISAIAYKRLIEETLPRLIKEKNLGKDALTRLYIAQDLYLYQESLRQIHYIEELLERYIQPKLKDKKDAFRRIKEIFLTSVDTHEKPLTLRVLRDLGFNVTLINEHNDKQFKELETKLVEYHTLTNYAFTLEKPGRLAVLIDTPFGEVSYEAMPLHLPPATSSSPPLRGLGSKIGSRT